MSDNQRVLLFLSAFNKVEETMVFELRVPDIQLKDLHAIFGVDPEDPTMTYMYPIKAEHQQNLERLLPVKMDWHSLDYFLECRKE